MIGHALPVYQGYASQHGYGLGNVLGGIIRSAIPIVQNITRRAVKTVGGAAKTAGTDLLQTGLDFVAQKIAGRKRKSTPSNSKPTKKRKRMPVKRTTMPHRTIKQGSARTSRHFTKRGRTNKRTKDIFSK